MRALVSHLTRVHAHIHAGIHARGRPRSRCGDAGQSTAEYALILVAVTAMVGVVIAYVSGDGGGMITALFGAAFAKMRALVGG